MATDLEIAVQALQYKKPYYDALWSYYEGNAPLIYNTARLREIFKTLEARFTQNWSAVVVDSVLDRMELRTPTISDQQAKSDALATVWEAAGMPDDEQSIHEDVAVTGEAFVIAWPDETGAMQAFYNDARLCHMFYEPANPRKKRYAVKWWQEVDETLRLTLYYPDRLEYYQTTQRAAVGDIIGAASFVLTDEGVARNESGAVPVFHFRSTTRGPRSQLQNVTETQDAINKLLADMMVAAEFGAFRQRWAITNANLDGIKARPDTIVRVPPADLGDQPVSIGEFSTTDLRNYLDSISQLSTAIGIVTRTPKHYFYAQGSDPSGEALIAMESPLTRKVSRLQATLRPVWRELAGFLLGVDDTSNIWIAYEDVETVQPMTEAQIALTWRQTGMPLATVLKEQGWTPEDLDEVADDGKLLPLAPAEAKLQREALMMDDQLGVVSAETLAGELGYDWAQEKGRIDEETANTGDTLLTQFDRGDVMGGVNPAMPANMPPVTNA